MSIAILLALTAPASAQTTDDTTDATFATAGGFDAHGFRLVSLDADPRDPLRMQRPGQMEAGSWYAGGLGEYANEPLVFQGASATTPTSVLSNVVGANLVAGVVAAEQVRFDLSVPIYLASNGPSGSNGAGLGDVRLSSLVSFLQPDDAAGVGVGGVAALDVPTGAPEDFLGDTGVAGLLAMVGTYEMDDLTFTSQAGVRFAPNTDTDVRPAPTEGGDAFQVGGAVGYLVTESTGLTLEADMSLALASTVRTAIGLPAEATLSVRHVREQGAHVTGGVGVGLGRGAGASPVRLLIGGGFGSASVSPADADGDGFTDRNDDCVSQPETVNGYKDEDGCPDTPPATTFTGAFAGEPQDDAVVKVNGDAGSPAPRAVSGVAGQPLEVVVEAGQCLRGRTRLSFGEVDASVAVPLERVQGTVEITVTSEAGDPLGGAQVRYITEDDRCLPKDRSVSQSGTTHEVGPGEYMIFVTAQGYSIYRQAFTIEEGGKAVVNAKLKPTKVQVEGNKITILEKVFFETGKAVIDPRSFPLLDEVASTIQSAPLSGPVEVQGHTDDQGNDSANLRLSQSRAEAVRTYLIGKGVADTKLTAKGYGETKPIADNTTEAGRTANRRVEFVVVPPAE